MITCSRKESEALGVGTTDFPLWSVGHRCFESYSYSHLLEVGNHWDHTAICCIPNAWALYRSFGVAAREPRLRFGGAVTEDFTPYRRDFVAVLVT